MKYAFIGYSYQWLAASLLLAKMDAERNIDELEIEAAVKNNFDDVKIRCGSNNYFFQIKDMDQMSLDKLVVSGSEISIKGKAHKLSDHTNIIIFKQIEIEPNCEILGIPAYNFSGVYIITMSRTEMIENIHELYALDENRKNIIEYFFNDRLDQRILKISRDQLPSITLYSTELLEATVDVARERLSVENILLIEGKPGVGKSHFVKTLTDQYPNHILYRFWTSSQDKDYDKRLKYDNFLSELSKKVFSDYQSRDEKQILKEVVKNKAVVIIDGLDHVENYNTSDLEKFIAFINKLQKGSKTIILSRPLQRELTWEKYILGNWNLEQTIKVLNELYHISGYSISHKIFTLTDGYPILVKYIAEHYKKEKSIPDYEKFDSVDNYYRQLITNEKGKQALAIFLCSHTYTMRSELDLFLEDGLRDIVTEFIEEHPYLFEVRLNRIALFHDSLVTYLRKLNINYVRSLEKINNLVYDSIMAGEIRFMSRVNFYSLSDQKKNNITKKYSSIVQFKELISQVVDFEAIQSFYFQVRENLSFMNPAELEIIHFYDLSLIINMVQRDHLSTLHAANYTYLQGLIANGYTEEDITSGGYLFSMLYYLRTNNASLILNLLAAQHYDTQYFYRELEKEIKEERTFFSKHDNALSASRISELLKKTDSFYLKDLITHILQNLYIHQTKIGRFKDLFTAVDNYMNGNPALGREILQDFIALYQIDDFKANWILKDVKKYLYAFGLHPQDNDYKCLSLHDVILKNKNRGSYNLRIIILNYIRLALHEKRQIHIAEIDLFWCKYYNRKDYSMYGLDVALKLFQDKGFAHPLKSISLIGHIQNISEKGYNDLLASYIVQHPPGIIHFISENFEFKDLSISWLDLPTDYINVMPNHIFQHAFIGVLRSHSYSKQIDYRDIANVLGSVREMELKAVLKMHGYKIKIEEKSPEVKILKSKDINFETTPLDKISAKIKSDSTTRYKQGILKKEDEKLIKEKGLQSYQVAGFANGNYSALADSDIFTLFSKEDIRKNIKLILFNALTGKMESISAFHDVYLYPGNLLKIAGYNEVEIDYALFFKSFTAFLELSLFDSDLQD
ncbi:hypothetical protein ASF10_22195 [Flavobacterium sp. Leaf82]|uniref:AAA family ATPase n=1 Tax=Flavobacterium sp. Leaf82 TaxID=1736238 RepID=UPI0006F9801D|nr:AAA family ATPase [Flavobacterium sp. Leaf82]KQO31350.1 hypothetical protein ASF10_22195 [Flavobacterium sp. Leaf82]